ncbi:MAG: 6-phosphofructokinase [Oscillospiraceae bacterium]|nr:6-phosphofructokinase [Oscillospiraceae bacterium]
MRFAVAQSGGPTCAINASLVGIYKAATEMSNKVHNHTPISVLGVHNGIQGLMDEQFVDLSLVLTSEETVDLLRKTPSTALGSCRFRLPVAEQDDSLYGKIFCVLQKHAIDVLFYIGGNDSMDTVAKLSAWIARQGSDIRIIGVPKTIDNDLVGTDHTPGFGSAAKYVAMTMQEVVRDSSVYRVPSVTICEIMGRDAGWLTASTCLLRANGEEAPHLIYLPEHDFSTVQFIHDVQRKMESHRSVICAVSEGIVMPQSESYRSGASDAFGHAYLSGIGKHLEQLVRQEIGCKVRSIELNVMQRCAAHLASATDLDEAEAAGRYAVELAMEGKSGCMVTLQRDAGSPQYRVTCSHIAAASAANVTRTFPATWINEEGNDVTDEAVDYFLPLIQGEVLPTMRNGMPVHFRLASNLCW